MHILKTIIILLSLSFGSVAAADGEIIDLTPWAEQGEPRLGDIAPDCCEVIPEVAPKAEEGCAPLTSVRPRMRPSKKVDEVTELLASLQLDQ